MSNYVGNFLLALTFFSRLPLPEKLGKRISHDPELSSAVAAFPLVGMLIGFLVGAVWYVACQFLPPLVAAGLAIVSGTILTGGLHEDGLADCADGLGGSTDREKALEIMRDSRLGAYGAIAIVTSIALRWAALASLTPVAGFLSLLIVHSASRTAIIIAMRYSSYARKEGLGQQASGDIPSGGFETAIVISVAIALLSGWFFGLLAWFLGFAAAWLALKYLEKRLGGYTGDGLGTMEQIAEIIILVALSGLWA
ncbi:MAG: adenosylcobinamide-GDP ribazoletransferase [Rhizobiaceae bacterium]